LPQGTAVEEINGVAERLPQGTAVEEINGVAERLPQGTAVEEINVLLKCCRRVQQFKKCSRCI
jgi:hypothetical protein